MSETKRRAIVDAADTIVVKVGTRVLTHADGTLHDQRVAAIAEQIAQLQEAGRRVALVSSGAVGAGMGRLQLPRRPSDLGQLQATAAVGQSRLIEAYNRCLETHGRHAAQVLLTADDLNDRTRYLNVRNTILAIFEFGAVPIINENDTVSVDELQLSIGDNDRLAAMVTNLIRAPLLVLLSDVDGLFDGDPHASSANLIPVVEQVDRKLRDMVCDDGAPGRAHLSRGGMASKLEAARIATAAGENVVIANGHHDNVLLDVLAGKPIGTLILAQGPAVASRKRWIGWAADTRGTVAVDAGARRAVERNGRSLLPIGVVRVEGNFDKGDVVVLCDEQGAQFARGLTNYAARELRMIAGCATNRIDELLGHRPYDEVIHRDNLTLLVE